MTIEERREAWAMEKWIWKWVAISTGVVGAILIILTVYLNQMGLFELGQVIVVGGVALQLVYLGVSGLISRISSGRPENPLRDNVIFGAGLVVILLLIVGQAYAGIPGFFSYFIIGTSVVAFGNSLLKSREVHEPRGFVEIENDGAVLQVKQGDMLLTALEAHGYRLLTHCGATGDCASCRVNLVEVRQSITSENHGPLLTPRQQNEGWAITCRLPVHADMKVRLYKPLVVRWAGFNRHEMGAEARELREALPGFDCEACGYKTCDQYAIALNNGEVDSTACLPGGEAVSKQLDRILSESPSAREIAESDQPQTEEAEVSNA